MADRAEFTLERAVCYGSARYDGNKPLVRMEFRRSAVGGEVADVSAVPASPDVPPRLVKSFRALGDPTRLALLRLLAVEEHAVGDLVRALGIAQPAVSRHLRVLREAELVVDERRARRIVYRIAPGA